MSQAEKIKRLLNAIAISEHGLNVLRDDLIEDRGRQITEADLLAYAGKVEKVAAMLRTALS